VGITRIRLQEILAAAAGNAKHRLGVAVTALAREAGRVSVGFSDGSSGGYDLVVGADGIYSTVRRPRRHARSVMRRPARISASAGRGSGRIRRLRCCR
jgi:2-polyprenyl-6-methoxyphenol hydroxylase-like FAD-dependent oxidoreductase